MNLKEIFADVVFAQTFLESQNEFVILGQLSCAPEQEPKEYFKFSVFFLIVYLLCWLWTDNFLSDIQSTCFLTFWLFLFQTNFFHKNTFEKISIGILFIDFLSVFSFI